jgi:hypothetical protein
VGEVGVVRDLLGPQWRGDLYHRWADAVREAVAWGTERGVETRGVLVANPAFAGRGTIAQD